MQLQIKNIDVYVCCTVSISKYQVVFIYCSATISILRIHITIISIEAPGVCCHECTQYGNDTVLHKYILEIRYLRKKTIYVVYRMAPINIYRY